MGTGTTALFGVVFWLRLWLVAIWVGVPVLFVGVLLWWTTRRGRGGPARAARLVGLGLGALVGVVAVWVAQLWLAPIAVAAGYLLGVLRGELRATPPPTESVRVASLRPRTARHYLPWWTVLVSVGAAAVTMLGPVVLSAVPTASYGSWNPLGGGDPRFTLPGMTLAWPRASEWVPLAVVAGGALVVGALLIRRALWLPAGSAGLAETGRRNAARAIAGTVLGVELVALGAQALFASSGLAVPAEVGGTAYLWSRVLVWTGIGLAVTGVVVWCVLSRWRRGPVDVRPAASA
ncbi:MAG TPA: hypothetical protein VHW44_15610 [Pseudonocardiaceae bacterium]|nr:hypothetical protein [Pseudonocardiaceae bacterium]